MTWTHCYVKYLGLKISKRNECSFQTKFHGKIEQTQNIEKWRTLSLIGWVSATVSKWSRYRDFCIYFRTSLFLLSSLFLSFLTPLSCALSRGTKHRISKNQGNVGVQVCRVFCITTGLPMSELWCTGSMALREWTSSSYLLG